MAGLLPRLSKYRLLARLGTGGMAEVYLAVAENSGSFQKLQVLKIMRSDLSDQERPDFLRMFEDEARLAARLNHPNIVQSYEVGFDDGQPFLVMEYLEGQPLSRVQQRALRNRAELFPLEMQLFVLCEVLEGLEYAHTLTDYDGTPLDIVHRDVSPQNVFVTYAGHTKLVDFGIAKTMESSKTRAGVVKGKVAYMAPEQVLGRGVDSRLDLFSVGVMLWEAIAGCSMHADLSVYQAMNRLVIGDLPPIRAAVPDVDPELERIVNRALAHRREDRYQDAASFRHDLASYADSFGKVRAREVGARVAQLFAAERVELDRVIREAMSGNSEPQARVEAVRNTRVIPGELHRSAPPEVDVDPQTVPQEDAPTLFSTPTRTPHPPPQRTDAPPVSPGRAGRFAGWATAGMVVAAALVYRQQTEKQPTRSTWSAPKASAEQAAETVHLHVRAYPEQAAMILDGRKLARNPYEGHAPKDKLAHRLVVTAPGFVQRSLELRFERDLDLDVHLAPATGATVTSETAQPIQQVKVTPKIPNRTAGSTSHMRRNVLRTPPQATAIDLEEPFRDFPSPRRPVDRAPQLDTSDPWATEEQASR